MLKTKYNLHKRSSVDTGVGNHMQETQGWVLCHYNMFMFIWALTLHTVEMIKWVKPAAEMLGGVVIFQTPNPLWHMFVPLFLLNTQEQKCWHLPV